MIQFDSNGNLYPPQIIETDFETFKSTFVEGFEGSRTRIGIFEQYIEYLNDLRGLFDAPFYQWIDGSFVTRKINPNDIDLVTFVDFEIYNQNEKTIDEYRRSRYAKDRVLDGYFVKTYPESHKRFNFLETDKLQWFHTFNRVKNTKLSKGFLQINF